MLLKQIQYFMAVAQTRHFTRASEQMYVSQSALSQQITKLENDMGVTLINRLSHPIELTKAGEEFAKYGADVLTAVENLQEHMQTWQSTGRSTLHIGMITGLGNLPLADILAKFNTEHSDIKLTLATQLSKALCEQLEDGTIDLAIIAAPRDIEKYNFNIIPLQQDPFVVILPAGHPMAKNKVFDLVKASKERFIFPTKPNVSLDVFMEECKAAGFEPNIASFANDPGRRIDMVEAGLGIALISKSGLSYYLKNQKIAALPLKKPFYKNIVVARKKGVHKFPALCAFWNYVQQFASGEIIK
ncbi:LysR family transcriptional regulator [Schwartzia succinivorans]|uniref:DNA-binding transcriptional regulator, LysR family n=1 Tax=Schwartzia succinivorans DSM 10502 TaxID=1123243 RepID=A0A1M4ZA54_9FIRM|nr:LysR family transcriptional regulator [Schwartzia succinivorans]SHF14466.1 DNA-binding transcriptional regulator, LysR family [Schwartzia succinivorans DSM 10502]